MARPKNKGLEYYSQDTSIHSDRKIRRLLKEFGACGYLVYDYIKSQCYKENGYWVQFDDGFCFDVADVLQAGITEKLVMEVIKGCIRMSLFDAEVFNMFNIITSNGIQKRYIKVKQTAVIDPRISVMVDEIGENEAETTENDPISTQRKEKERESKIKEKQSAFAQALDPFLLKYGRELLNEFYKYWSESQPHSVKLRWELQDTWELPKRLSRWASKNEQFNS